MSDMPRIEYTEDSRIQIIKALATSDTEFLNAATAAGSIGKIALAPATEDLPTLTLYTAMISHGHGEDVTIHLTEDSAYAEIEAWVDSWWDSEMDGADKPENPSEAVQQYFERVEDEWFSVTGASLNI